MGKKIPVWLDTDGELSMVCDLELHQSIGGDGGVMGVLGTPRNGPLEVLLRRHVKGLKIELEDESGYFERPGEIYRSSTELRAATALSDSGLSAERIKKAMKALQDAGILLREKGTST